MNNLTHSRYNLQPILTDFPKVSLIYLFGSQVNGNIGPISDYDFGILLDYPIDELTDQVQITHALVTLLDTPQVDVVLLHKAPVELAYAVIAQGQLLYQRDVATRVEYEAQIMSRYGDYLPVLRAQRNQVLAGEGNDTRIQRYRAAFGRTERTLGQIATATKQNAS